MMSLNNKQANMYLNIIISHIIMWVCLWGLVAFGQWDITWLVSAIQTIPDMEPKGRMGVLLGMICLEVVVPPIYYSGGINKLKLIKEKSYANDGRESSTFRSRSPR